MRTIAVLTGSRADYGLLRPVLRRIEDHPRLDLRLIVTGTHLDPRFGETYQEIENDGFRPAARVEMLVAGDTGAAMASSTGLGIIAITQALQQLGPNILLIPVDRFECLAAAIAAAMMNIFIAHMHGGDVSGSIDESIRHAISKFAHIHFTSSELSRQRLLKMGEHPDRVFKVGAPGLDSIREEKLLTKEELCAKYGLDASAPLILAVYHPVTTEQEDATRQIRTVLDSLIAVGYQTLLLYPNADAGGRGMVEMVEAYVNRHPALHGHASLPHLDYLSAMASADVMVGNSSSGIVEAPSFKLPVVNIGSRQQGRERADNVVDVPCTETDIVQGIALALYDPAFRNRVAQCTNPYGDGWASERIVSILADFDLDPQMLQKTLTY
ncbi:UDP-N-acetylglucosamine 2-epimerase [Nitrospinae bacterium AH_259_B05_G02_I21]|nr:UDP-N-acetylglucosamine 2-epimerase [Nitrospinae bacterium AH_259_B05_G02_I21]